MGNCTDCYPHNFIALAQVDNQLHVFRAGEAFYIECGTMLSWAQPSTVRKFYVIYAPAANEEDKGDASTKAAVPEPTPRPRL
jgi:hypothetical protein